MSLPDFSPIDLKELYILFIENSFPFELTNCFKKKSIVFKLDILYLWTKSLKTTVLKCSCSSAIFKDSSDLTISGIPP